MSDERDKLVADIDAAMTDLSAARATGDALKIELAEATLNNVLDLYVTFVTGNNHEEQQ